MAFGKRNHKKSDKRKSVDENSDSSHRRDNQTDIDDLRSLTSKKQKDFLSLIITVAICTGLFMLVPIVSMAAITNLNLSFYRDTISFNNILPKGGRQKSGSFAYTEICGYSGSRDGEPGFGLVILRENFDRTTKYLACTMRVEKERLCHRGERQELVRTLKAFIAGQKDWVKRDKMTLHFARALSKFQMRRFEKFQSDSDDEDDERSRPIIAPFNPDAETVETPPERLPLEIGNAFYNLMKEGYITKADFGWFGYGFPKELDPFVPSFLDENGACDG